MASTLFSTLVRLHSCQIGSRSSSDPEPALLEMMPTCAPSARAKRYSKAEDYPDAAREGLKEMHRQVGDLVLDERGIAVRGILLRHLVMPGDIAGTREVMRFIATEVSPDTYVNLMDQYHPAYKTHRYPEIDRLITEDEYRQAWEAAREEGIHRLDGRAPRRRIVLP